MDSKELAYFMDAGRRGDETEVAVRTVRIADHARDIKGFTPLIIAVYNNQPKVAKLLIQKGADVNSQDASGNTALMGACFKGTWRWQNFS